MQPAAVGGAFLRPVFAIVVAVCAASAANAATLRARVDLGRQPLRVEETAGGTRVSIDGLRPATGGAVPAARRVFYVPEGYRVGAVRVSALDDVAVGESSRLAQAGPAPTDPATAGVSLGGGNLGGFRLHTVELHPVRWERASGRLTRTTSFDVELELLPDTPAGVLSRLRPNPRADETIRKAIASLIQNPGDLPPRSERAALPPGPVGFAPEELPSTDGSGVDMVIVTTAALEPHFAPLADWKTRKGVPTVVRTVEWIDANYPFGVDRPERIRSFLRDAYEKWGMYLVLLGGDDQLVPPRDAWTVFYIGGSEVPTDQYFACLDGDWNGDGDDKIGEGQFTTDPGDSADSYPDVFVGRAAVEDSVEVATFVAKSFTYDRTPPAGYVETHGALGEVLFPQDWVFGNSPASITLDGKALIVDSLDVELPAGWARSLRFQVDDDEDQAIALTELNFGNHVLSVMGHGDAFKFSVGNGTDPHIRIADSDTLSNGDRLTFLLAVACNPNQFDLESQGESFMNNPAGGTIAVLGSSRVDFPQWSTSHARSILNMAFQHGVTRLGAMSQLGRVPFAQAAQSDQSPERWTWLTKTLLGDPELRLWTQEPQNLVVSHASSVPLGGGPVTVSVTDTLATAVAGALVCVSDGNGTYSRALTDPAGAAVLPITSTQAGTADVVVTNAEFRPYEGTLTVDPAVGPLLVKIGDVMDDDAVAPSSGNGDGLLDAGESVELAVTVQNAGDALADSAGFTATVEAGGSATFDLLYGGVADPTRVFIGPARVNPGAVPFTLDFAAPTTGYVGRPRVTFSPDSTAGSAAADVGIFVWQDREGWHVRWGGGADTVTVAGTVTTDGRVRRASGLDLEVGDSHGVSVAGDSLSFSGTTGATDVSDGVDFTMSDSTMVTMTTASASLGSVSAAGQAVGTVVFDVAAGARDGQIATVDLSLTSVSGGPWSADVPLVFVGPELDAYVFSVQDSGGVLSGDGDGVIETGETVRLTPTVINRGAGAATGVNGAATAPGGITFTDTADSYGNVVSLAETSGADGYVFTVDDSTGTSIDLTLTDSVGRVWAKTVDFLAPVAPDSAWFTSTSTRIDVKWTPADSTAYPDVAGYNIYRSATSGSGHTKQNVDLLRAASRYSDSGLSLGSTFFYQVTTVDSSGNESPAGAEIQGWTTQVQVAGWPQFTAGFMYPGVLMADADRDGRSEVYAGSHDKNQYGWNFEGATLSGFPVVTGAEVWGTAAFADVDEDGDGEVLWGSLDARLYAVHHDGSPLFGANQYFLDLNGTGAGMRSAVTLSDVDNDGHLEIFVGADLGTVYAFNHDGTGLIDSTGLFYTAPGGVNAKIWGTIAIADLDGDGTKEIGFSSWNDSLYVVDPTGALLPGFPKGAADDFRGGPVFGDLDNDGTLEIVAGSFDGNLYAYNDDGSDYVPGGILAVLPAEIGGAATLCNVDGDPELEIFVGSFDANLYAFNHDGTSFLPGAGGVFATMPLGPTANDGVIAAPIVVDVDGDSDFEIFVGHRNYKFYGFHHDGSTVLGMPIPTGEKIFSTAAAGDIDGDGDVDIAFASYDGTVSVLDFPGPSTPEAYEWATQGANVARTATYGDPGPATDIPQLPPRPYELALGQNVPNPFPGATTIEFVAPVRQRVSLKVYNVEGRLIRTLLEGTVPAGPNRARWDGRDTQGRALASGIYFYRLDNGHRTVTRKGVLLR